MRSYFNALLCVLIVLIAVQASAPDAYDAVVPETDLFQDLDAVNVNDFLVKKTLKESGFFEGERADKTADSDEDTLFKATKAYASTFAQDADADEFADVEEETPYPQTYKELVHETTTPPPPPPSTQQRHEEEAAPDSDPKPANVEETSDGPGSEKDSIITATHATTGFPDGDKPILGYTPDLDGTPLPGNQGHDGGSMPYKASEFADVEEQIPYPQTYSELEHETKTPPPPPPSTQQRHEEEAAPDSDPKPANVEETSDGPGSEKDSIITATHATTGFPDGDKPILGYTPDLNGTPLPGNQGHDGGSMPYKAATMSEEELNAIFEPLPQQKPPKKLVEEIPEEDKTLENIGQRIKHKLHRRITKNNWLDNM